MNLFKGILSIAILLTVASCTKQENTGKQYFYFDVEGFFKAEASRLDQVNPNVSKTVRKNKDTETRNLKIDDWQTELELFKSSDINKPAWRNSYKTETKGGLISYTATSPELRTRNLVIEKDGTGKVKRISTANEVSNPLYSSTEILEYYPDSLYKIQKKQNVKLLGENTYFISGKIKD